MASTIPPLPLPPTHKALVLTSRDQPLTVQDLPTPEPVPGSAIVAILSAGIISYSGDVYNGTRPYPFPTPMVPGCSAVGRIAALGPDATSLTPGQLVLIDATIRSRDNPTDVFLQGLSEGFSPGSVKLMAGEWRNGTFAEYAKVPLENCFALNEALLLRPREQGGLGYRLEALSGFTQFMVAYGGLSDVNVRAGETVIVAPATGAFGGGAVRVALAMGARVLAMGRNTSVLAALAASAPPGRVVPIPLTADPAAGAAELAKHGPADVYFDISPTAAGGSHHVVTCIQALRWGGRVSLMGGLRGEVGIPHMFVMRQGITLKGTWMYSREQVHGMIRLVERGVLSFGEDNVKIVEKFELADWKEAFESARVNAKPGQVVVFTPRR